MSGAVQPETRRRPRAIFQILLNALGLAIWAAHFGLIYAVHALSCERDWAAFRLLGLPWVPVAVVGLTALALGALWLVFRGARRDLTSGPWDEGGEAEPRFTAWFAAATAAYSALAVLFQAAPALVVPGCA
jgi:hypothetical protein